jgi:hypothetical protein
MTLHPEGKEGVNVDKEKYEAVKQAILDAVGSAGELPFSDLSVEVEQRVPVFDGSYGWYTTIVKLDLEARGLIERVPKKSPQYLRLSE